jgi:N-acetylneuraminic acid mutarotase
MKKWIIVLIVVLSSLLFSSLLFADAWTKKADDFGGSERNRAVAFTIDGKGYLGTGQGPIIFAPPQPPVMTFLKDLWRFDPADGVVIKLF